jgi:hypothetical protein
VWLLRDVVDLPRVVGYLLPDLASIPADVRPIRREVLTYLRRRSLISITCMCCDLYRVKSLLTAWRHSRLSSGAGCGSGSGAGVGRSGSDRDGVVKGAPFTTFAYDVPFVLAFAFVLATSNSRFNLSITLRWSRLRCCCCCCC